MVHNKLLAAVAAVFFVTAAASPAEAQNYTVNGQFVTPQLEAEMYAAGLPPGHYWYDANSGSYGIVGNSTPIGNIHAGTYHSPGLYGGSGEIYNNGSWSYYNPLIGEGGVGGDGQGCYYAYGWSNC